MGNVKIWSQFGGEFKFKPDKCRL